jgi:zinc protease
MNIPFNKHTLANGLDVIVHEDHSCPIVAVNIGYHVGSKNERPGRTGFAHLFEHLMFEGSQHDNRGYFYSLQQAGADLNGSTNADRTNYWEVVPTSALDLALWMESDRMGHLLPALTREKFENQRDVVLNERRQNYENRPYGMVGMATMEALYPTDHPYSWMTIGRVKDLQAAELDEVRSFFRTFYGPGNASLTIAGDVEVDKVFEMAEHYFEEIPGRPAPPAVALEEPLICDERRLLLEDRIELPRLYLAWHSPQLFGPGDAELDLLSDVLSNGKASRLYRTLVHKLRLATDVSVVQSSRELSGVFQIVATATPGHTLSELDDVISVELERISADELTTDELHRSLVQIETNFVCQLDTVGGFGGKSDQLNGYNVVVNDPGYFEADLSRYRNATSAAIGRISRDRLSRHQRIALSVVPIGATKLALPDSVVAEVS